MGVISFFKNKFYDSRLTKAGRLLQEGRKEESIQIYRELLGKHAEAAGILAGIFYEDIKKYQPKAQVERLRSIVELPNLNGQELKWDRTGYDRILAQTVSFLYSDAKNHLSANRFKNAYIILNELRAQKLASPEMLSQYVDACLGCIKDRESIDLNSLRIAINNLGDEATIFNAYDRFIPYVKKFSPEYIRSSKWYILHERYNFSEAVKVFEKCWTLVDADEKERGLFIGDVFKDGEDGLLKELFKHIEANPDRYLRKEAFSNAVIIWADGLSSHAESIDHLVRLHNIGVRVQQLYEKHVHSRLSELDLAKQRELLNQALNLFPDSERFLDDKLHYAETLAKEKHYSEALEICDELTGKHNDASLTKSKVYVCIAQDEMEPVKKMDALSLATSLIKTEGINYREYKRVTSKIDDISLDAALSYHKSGDKSKAYEIVREIKTVRSALLLASFLAEDASDVADDKLILYYRDSIEELKGKNVQEVLESDSYIGLWAALTDVDIKSCKKADHNSTIEIMKGLVEALEKEAALISSPSRYSSIIEKAKKEQIKRMYLLAREQEKDGHIEEASSLYRDTKKVEGKSSISLADFRYVICKLKAGNTLLSVQNGERIESLLEKAPSAFVEERNEVAYRYALQLLRAGKTDNSLRIVNQYLPQESTLKQACEQQFIIDGLNRLKEFNSQLELIRSRQLSSDDAIHMVNHMLEFAEEVKYVLKIDRSTLSKYRKSIKNYAILKLFDEGKYDVAFDKLKKEHIDFLEDLTSLRNIAIVCLNMAESGMITDNNYEDVISIWLTAIYQERLFIKSLDYTSWDDQFTFSLADAYGHFDEDTVGDLPDNINFDEPDGSTTNVAIRDVQQSLLNRFEAAINENNQYLRFFNEQKEAMDDLLELHLDEKCRIVAPHLADESEDIFSEIESAFETDRESEYDNYEDVLATGYKFGLTGEMYIKYHEASENFDECVSATEELNLQRIKSAYRLANILHIREFPRIRESLVSFVKGKVGSLGASDKSRFEQLYSCYIVICTALHESTVSFPFANFVMQHIVSEVNGNRISKARAADYILSVYLLDTSNHRTQENLTTLFEMLAREDNADSRNAVSTILNRVQSANTSLYQKLNHEYQQVRINKELNEIVDKVNNDVMTKSSALERVYNLYASNPNNSRICENLAVLCNLCVIEYIIGQKPDPNNVRKYFRLLLNNMSLEFKRHSKVFKDSYKQIWSSLPIDTRRLLSDDSWDQYQALTSRVRLNANGLALQGGLNLLKGLGCFTPNTTLGRLYLLDNDNPF